jgi:hypothetical protein
MSQLAQRFGFVVECVVDNSKSFQIVASERYRKDVALIDQDASVSELVKSFLAFFKARKLNSSSMGDQCIFVIRKGPRQ